MIFHKILIFNLEMLTRLNNVSGGITRTFLFPTLFRKPRNMLKSLFNYNIYISPVNKFTVINSTMEYKCKFLWIYKIGANDNK